MAEHARQRQDRLLAELRALPAGTRILTGDVLRSYQAWGLGTARSTVRHDLEALARRGALIEHGPENDRFYTLNHAKDTNR